MNADEMAQRLHDKATRSMALSSEEEARLKAWYARQDQEEAAALAGAFPPHTVAALQARLDAAVAQLGIVALRIQTLTAENEAVRREIADLQRRLAQKLTTQPA
jgi:hypothetical protein